MKFSQLPFVATWLLQNLNFGRRNDSLVGDIIEEYRCGHSRSWYWKQVTVAIVQSFVKEFRAHPLLAVRAVVIGWSALYLGRLLLGSWPDMIASPFNRIVPEEFDPVGHSGFIWWVCWIPVTAASGWIVGRFHRRHRSMIFIFSASVLLWDIQKLPWICTLSIDVLSNSRYLPYLVSNLAGLTLPPASILVAGLWNSPHRDAYIGQGNTLRLGK